MSTTDEKRAGIFAELEAERLRQDAKWGEQNHPMVPAYWPEAARLGDVLAAERACEDLGIRTEADARDFCEAEHEAGRGTYTSILLEEVAEFVAACVEHGEASDQARAELVQVTAVCLAMLERLDRVRGSK